jgi:hypothetical protein
VVCAGTVCQPWFTPTTKHFKKNFLDICHMIIHVCTVNQGCILKDQIRNLTELRTQKVEKNSSTSFFVSNNFVSNKTNSAGAKARVLDYECQVNFAFFAEKQLYTTVYYFLTILMIPTNFVR